MVRMNITISDNLDTLSSRSDTSKSEIFRKALTLFAVALEGKREGKSLLSSARAVKSSRRLLVCEYD